MQGAVYLCGAVFAESHEPLRMRRPDVPREDLMTCHGGLGQHFPSGLGEPAGIRNDDEVRGMPEGLMTLPIH